MKRQSLLNNRQDTMQFLIICNNAMLKINKNSTSPFSKISWGHWYLSVLDFWWRLSGFQSQSGQPYLYLRCDTFPEICLWCDTCWPLFHILWADIGGAWNWDLSCHCSQCETRQAGSYAGLAYLSQSFILLLTLNNCAHLKIHEIEIYVEFP